MSIVSTVIMFLVTSNFSYRSTLGFWFTLLGFLIFIILLGAGGVLARKKCAKAAKREKQKDLLLKMLVDKTNEIEKGLNEDGGSTGD